MEKKTSNKLFDWIKPHNWGLVKVYRDFENFADWKKVIESEKADPNSKFNKWKLEHTKLYDIFITISLDESDAQLPEVVKRTKVLESLNTLNRYLDEDLGFAGSLSVELNQFEDDKGNPTLSYFIVYRFIFEKFSIKWLAKILFYIGVISFVTLHFHLGPLLITWLSAF